MFKVTATDRGTPKRSAIAYLTITVSDTNDHAPVFEQNEYRVSIRENVEVGFEVITIRATDGDAPSNANMIYKIVNDDEVNTYFEIDPRNGLVKTRVRPDREVKIQYRLFVEADDQGREPGPRTATATVHIFIEDENDNYPQFSEKRYVVQVPENIAVNSQVAVVKATDNDAGNNAKCITASSMEYKGTVLHTFPYGGHWCYQPSRLWDDKRVHTPSESSRWRTATSY